MRRYDSIPRDFMEFTAYCFAKLDGNNLRFEWTKKGGWNKFGTRRRLFDIDDPEFGKAIPLFHEVYAPDLEQVIKKEKWQKVIMFMEFYGDRSLGGFHEDGDEMKLALIDVNPHKQGILSPKEFVKLFNHLDFMAPFLGIHNWNRQLLQNVRDDNFEGMSFEGIVGKALIRNRIVMRKAKTQKWIDAIMEKHEEAKALKIINS